jgi:hypothetical protein
MECFRGSIFKVPPIALDKLKEQGFDFEVVPPPSRDGSQPAAKGATPVAVTEIFWLARD